MSNNIDQLYKERFENFEAPVSDTLWDKIQEDPKWKQHLHRQKVRNIAIYAALAIVSISTCIALILLQPAEETPDLMDSEALSDETSVSEAETTVIENIAIQEQVTESLTDIPVQEHNIETTPVTDAIIENVQITPDNAPSNSDNSMIPPTNTNNPTTAEIPSSNTNNQAKKTSEENPTTKKIAEQPSEALPTPPPAESTSSNASLFSIPNAFTPNGDGLNETFKPVTAEEIISYQLDIFMMNGQHIFTSKSLNFGWNGEYQGHPANNGTYIYVIKYKDATGKEHIDKGQLLLMR